LSSLVRHKAAWSESPDRQARRLAACAGRADGADTYKSPKPMPNVRACVPGGRADHRGLAARQRD